MKKYITLFSAYFSSSLEYRASLFTTLLLQVISIGSTVILWNAVYRTRSSVGGYSFSQTLIYYLLVPLVGFVTLVVLSDKLSEEIRTGTFSNYLLKPYKIWLVSFAEVAAAKISFLFLVSPVFVGILWFLAVHHYINLHVESLSLAILISALAFLMHFILDFWISLFAFWTDDTWAFRHIKTILFGVFGGMNFPLEFTSGTFSKVLNFLPFKYFYYVPVAYLTGKQNSLNLYHDISQILLWSFGFAVLSFVMWKVGLKKYGAYGR